MALQLAVYPSAQQQGKVVKPTTTTKGDTTPMRLPANPSHFDPLADRILGVEASRVVLAAMAAPRRPLPPPTGLAPDGNPEDLLRRPR